MKSQDEVRQMKNEAKRLLDLLDSKGNGARGDRADVIVRTLAWVLGEAPPPLRLPE